MDYSHIVAELGPAGDNWGHEVLDYVEDARGSLRVQVKVWVRRRLIVGGLSELESYITTWGSGDPRHESPEEEGELRAVEDALMWWGFLPKMAAAAGIKPITDRLGPLGVGWGFEEIATEEEQKLLKNKFRSRVKVWVERKQLDPKGKGKMFVEACAAVPTKYVGHEEMAVIKAVRQAMILADISLAPIETVDPRVAMREQAKTGKTKKGESSLFASITAPLQGFRAACAAAASALT